VADAPVQPLISRAQDLAKGWLLAVVEDAPLADVGALPLGSVALAGPELCAALVDALARDEDLHAVERLAARLGAQWPGGPAGAVAALAALQAVVWSALLDELREPDAAVVAELAGRLAYVVDVVRGAVLQGGENPDAVGVVPDTAASATLDRAEPAIRSGAHAGWTDVLEGEVSRTRSSRGALSLLFVELEDAARLVAAEPAEAVRRALSRFAAAVRSALRRDDLLLAEGDGHAWVVVRSGRPGASSLAERIASEVACAGTWRGGPLTAAVGVAVLDEDARGAEGLIEAAEQAAFVAMASGISVARASGPPDAEDPDDR
jgi:GGDEF domain-containing protein